MVVVLLQLLHAAILWVLQFYPYPELFVYPYLTAGKFLPYSQILDQHFPGLMFLPVNLFTLGFTTPLSHKLLLILVILIQSALVYKISRSRLAVLAYTLWQPFFEGNHLWLDTFLGLFTLPSFYFFLRQRWLLSGVFLGLGVVFKQSLLPLVAFAGLVLLSRRQYLSGIKFSLAAVFPSLVMLLYFQRLGVLADFWYWTVKFNLTVYAADGKLAPTAIQLIKLSLPTAIVLIALIKDKSSRLAIGWLLFSVAGGIARFGLVHLQPAVPFLAMALSRLSGRRLITSMLVLSGLWQVFFFSRQSGFLQTAYFDSATYQLAGVIRSRHQAGQKIFLLGVQPHLYALTNTLPPAELFVFQLPWFLQVAGGRVLDSLATDPPQLIVFGADSTIDGRYLKDYAPYLVQYTTDHYRPVWQLGSVIIYESRD